MSRTCGCPAGFRHELVVKARKGALGLECWRILVANKSSEVSALQVKWLESKKKQQRREQDGPLPSLKRSWTWTDSAERRGPDSKVLKRGLRDEENDLAVGWVYSVRDKRNNPAAPERLEDGLSPRTKLKLLFLTRTT